jgi:hypothetical protein
MELFVSLDWVSIMAIVLSGAALAASVFSAIASARSADVALSAERRSLAAERGRAVRELIRTAANVELEARMAIQSFEDASRSAIANAACYSTPDRKRPFLVSNAEFQQKIVQIRERADHGITVEVAINESDQWIAKSQLELDKILAELSGEKALASMRAEQLIHVNRGIAEAVVASERARNIHVQQDHNGLLV